MGEEGTVEFPSNTKNDVELKDVKSGDNNDNTAIDSYYNEDTFTDAEQGTEDDHDKEDVLRVDARGLCGIIERIPIIPKLMCMQVSMVGMLVFMGILLYIQANNLQLVKATQQFSITASDVGRFVAALQDERDLTNVAIYTSQNLTTYTPLLAAYNSTDKNATRLLDLLAPYKTYMSPNISDANGEPVPDRSPLKRIKDHLDQFNETITELRKMRDSVKSGNANGVQVFNYYTSLVTPMLDILTLFAQDANSATIRSYVDALRLYEAQQLVKAQGEATLLSRRINAINARAMGNYVHNRDKVISQFVAGCDADIANVYYQTTDSAIISYLRVIETVLTFNRDCIMFQFVPPTYRLDIWVDNATSLNQQMRTVEQFIVSKFTRENEDKYNQSSALIVNISVLTLVFLCLSIAIGALMFYTIIGPWRRMNKIQREAIAKFVPRELLSLLGAAKIEDVTLGRHVELSVTIMDVQCQMGTSKSQLDMNKHYQLTLLNMYLESMYAGVTNNHGYVQQCRDDGFVALFKNAKDAADSSLRIQRLANMLNSTSEVKIMPSFTIHTNNVLIGIAGDEHRMQCIIIDNEKHIFDMLKRLSDKFNAKVLTTEKSLGKNAAHIRHRVLGSLKTGMGNPMVVVEILSKSSDKLSYKEKFASAVAAFGQQDYADASTKMKELAASYPDDTAVAVYLKQIERALVQYKSIMTDVRIKEALENQEMHEAFRNFCVQELSVENIFFWEDIERYKMLTSSSERRTMAQQFQAKYFSMDGAYTVNVNDTVKRNISAQVNAEGALDQNLFDKVQAELELLMNDTYSRFKESKNIALVCDALNKTSHKPDRVWLNDFI